MSGIESGYSFESGKTKIFHLVHKEADIVILDLGLNCRDAEKKLYESILKLFEYQKNNPLVGHTYLTSESNIKIELKVPNEVTKEEYEKAIQERDTVIKQILHIYDLDYWAEEVTPSANM